MLGIMVTKFIAGLHSNCNMWFGRKYPNPCQGFCCTPHWRQKRKQDIELVINGEAEVNTGELTGVKEGFLGQQQRSSLGVRKAHRRHSLPGSWIDEDWSERKAFLCTSNLVTRGLIILRWSEMVSTLHQMWEFGGQLVVVESPGVSWAWICVFRGRDLSRSPNTWASGSQIQAPQRCWRKRKPVFVEYRLSARYFTYILSLNPPATRWQWLSSASKV